MHSFRHEKNKAFPGPFPASKALSGLLKLYKGFKIFLGEPNSMGKISAFLPFLLFIAMLHTVAATTISGTTYEWYSLEPLQNVILDINTIPRQTVVADNGSFSFDITEPGSYLIKAQYFEDNLLKYEANEVISVQGEGNFRLDLILFPSLENDDFLFDDFNERIFPIQVRPRFTWHGGGSPTALSEKKDYLKDNLKKIRDL